jgi:hypothetical protein
VTYELQAASDVTSIPESRVNDMPMPPDLLDRDIPVTVKKDGFEKVCKYILSMIRCRNSGNTENFRREYFRPPLPVFKTKAGSQHFVIYGCGKSSARKRPDLYSAKKTSVKSDMTLEIGEKGAFGAVVLGGHGSISAKGKKPVSIESVSVFPDRDTAGGDEFFVAACAASELTICCESMEDLKIYQHFASGTNPEAANCAIPR